MSNTVNRSPGWGSAVIAQLIMWACFQMNATLVHLRRHIMETFKCIHLALLWLNSDETPPPLSGCALSHLWLTDRRLWLLRAASLSAAARSSLINGGHSVFLTTAERLGTNLTEFWMSSSVTSTTEQWSSSRGRGSAPPWVTHGSIWKGMDRSEIGHFHNLTPRGSQKRTAVNTVSLPACVQAMI